MDDSLTLMDQNLSALVLAWHRGDLAGARELGRQVGEWAGLEYPAIAMAAMHWQQLTQTPSLDDPVRCEAALTLLVSAVRRAHAVGEARSGRYGSSLTCNR